MHRRPSDHCPPQHLVWPALLWHPEIKQATPSPLGDTSGFFCDGRGTARLGRIFPQGEKEGKLSALAAAPSAHQNPSPSPLPPHLPCPRRPFLLRLSAPGFFQGAALLSDPLLSAPFRPVTPDTS